MAAGIVAAADARRRGGLRARPRGRLPPRAAAGGDHRLRRRPRRRTGRSSCSRTTCARRRASPTRSPRARALPAALPAGCRRPRPVDPVHLRAARRDDARRRAAEAAPTRAVVLLTDGPGNVAYYEHALHAARARRAAGHPRRAARGRRRCVLRRASERRPVDVVYRRTNEDRVRDEHGGLTAVGASARAGVAGGPLGLVNAFGNGVADDKLIHGHVEDFVRFYLGEEPLVRSVPTVPRRRRGRPCGDRACASSWSSRATGTAATGCDRGARRRGH